MSKPDSDEALAPDAAGEGVGPEELGRILQSFRESRVVLTGVELDIFGAVGEGATSAEATAKAGTDPRATEFLMNALAAMGLLIKKDGVFRNSPAAVTLTGDGRSSLMHLVGLWHRWSTLTDCVRSGTAVDGGELDERGEEWTEAFIAAMHAHASRGASAVVEAVAVDGVRRMLDVGGGSGAYSIAFARASESLHADILDLPMVVQIAQRHIDEAGLSDRITTRIGDMRKDPLGEGYDLVFLSAICHMFGPDENRALFAKAFAALTPGGRIVVQDFVLDPGGASPRNTALFAINMLVNTRAGGTYTEAQYAAWLSEAGFEGVRHVRMPGPAGLVVARRSQGAA